MQKSIASLFVAAIFIAVTCVAGCRPVPPANPITEPADAEIAVNIDPVERALAGVALRKAEQGSHSAQLVESHMSKSSPIQMMCGQYIMIEDPNKQIRYFTSTNSGPSLLENKLDPKWQKFC